MNEAIPAYVRELGRALFRGDPTERTHYPALKTLLQAGASGIVATVEPKRIACGAPDFVVTRGHATIGYIEAKDVGASLDEALKTDQLKRYRESLKNLVLTNFLEFRWFLDGDERGRAVLGSADGHGKISLAGDGPAELIELLSTFYLAKVPAPATPKMLAERMARVTRMVRDLIAAAFESEEEAGALHSWLRAFRETLIPDLSPHDFADMYAQTMAYGLFAARTMWPGGGEFTRKEAEYDPKTREMRGVYYTPEPVVSYIVRSVDWLLRERFGRPMGLADQNTLVLDPATGTGTFLYDAIKLIHDRLTEKGQAGAWNDYVSRHLLPRLFGFELLMAPYAVAHLKLGLQLQETGYEFATDQRLGVYLTNTLEEAIRQSDALFAKFISDEANEASRIKTEDPILVVTGNPPYSGHSANASWRWENEDDPARRRRVPTWIGRLIRDYYYVDGKPLGERNPKWLQDDYVKFIRFGQWRIDRTGQGILAFITNHGYLDNPTFRGMRQQLMETFTDIYVLNLHGGGRKKEHGPGGQVDKNVFDIQQGVAIGIFVKEDGKAGTAAIHYRDMWGGREEKYDWLSSAQLGTTDWHDLEPSPPFYRFTELQQDLEVEYNGSIPLNRAFPVSSAGIVTARDDLTIHFTSDDAWATVVRFGASDAESARQHFALGSDVRDWKVALAQKDVRDSGPTRTRLAPILYRPLDFRMTYYTGRTRGFMCRPRHEVMRHFVHRRNLGFITTRQTRDQWDVLATAAVAGHKSVAAYDINSIFPLYLYPRLEREGVAAPFETLVSPWPSGHDGRRPNLSEEFVTTIASRLSLRFVPDGRGDLIETFGPEDVFHYIYAVLHSPTYRERYAEFLKTDFPRIPVTSGKDLFALLAKKGAEIVALHTMESPLLDEVVATFPITDSNEVSLVRFDEPAARVWINKSQYFEGVQPQVWSFQIGGYQVCDKWLKDRKGRRLSYEDVAHYQKVVVALRETMRLMAEIDEAIPEWPIS